MPALPLVRFRAAFALVLFAPALAGLAAEKDLYGDPLPEGAKARLGTTRLRSSNFSSAYLSPDTKTLYVSSFNGVRLLDPSTGKVVGLLPTTPPGTLLGISADGKRGVNNSYDGTVVWDTASGKTRAKIAGRSVSSDWGAALSADGKVLALGGYADFMKKEPIKVTLWSVESTKEITTITAPQNQSANVALAPDGKTVAIWGGHYEPNAKPEDQEKSPGRFVYFYDATTGKEVSKVQTTGNTTQAVVIGPAGLAVVFADNSSGSLVDPKTGATKVQLLGRARMGRFAAFSPDGSVVTATAEDGAVQMWRASDGARIATIEPPVPGLYNTRVRMIDNDKGIAWATQNLATVVWEVPSGKPLSPTDGHTNVVISIAVTPDGKHALTSASNGGALRWELATGKLLGEVPFKHPGAGGSYSPALALSANGSRALVRDTYSGTGVYDTATGAQLYVVPNQNNSYAHGELSADGSKIVIVHTPADSAKKKPSTIQVLDTASGKRVGSVEVAGTGRPSAAVTPDGKYLVTAGNRPTGKGAEEFVVTGWDLATGAKKGEMVGKSQYLQPQVVAGPDNKTAGLATGDGKVIVFDFLEGKEVRSFPLGTRKHNSLLVLTPDGKRLAVACQPSFGMNVSTPILVFDWATGELLQTLTAPGTPPVVMTFSPDGKTLITSAPDTTATVWEVSK